MEVIKKLLSVIWSSKGVLALLFLFAAWFFNPLFYYPYFTYYGEYHDILNKFSKIPGVKVLDSRGLEDMTFENIHVTAEITGKGAIEFFDIGECDSFYAASCINVGRVGDFRVRISGCERSWNIDQQTGPYSPFWSSTIDVGSRGNFTKELSNGMVNIADAINRYNEIKNLVLSWPVCPDSILKETDIGWSRYCRTPISHDAWPGCTVGDLLGPAEKSVCDPNNK